jgi:hypothetical protein
MRFFYRLFNLFAACFRPAPQTVGYGYAWQPNILFANVQVVRLTNQDPPGLYVRFTQNMIDNPDGVFERPVDQIGIILLPLQPASVGFTQAMQGVTNDANLMQRLEGFLRYTHGCLDYIYAAGGQQLLDGLRNAPQAHTTYIEPSYVHNQTAGMSMCLVARWVVNSDMNISPAERNQLIQILEQASGAVGLNAFQWLANEINQMPLYSMFEQANAYPLNFLNANGAAVAAVNLQQWFNTGSNCPFVANLQLAAPIQGVRLLNFVKNAVIVLLYANSPRGPGSGNTVSFDIRDWSLNNIGEDQNQNEVGDRPPAIGLAHELIHAYYNAIGGEPGSDQGGYSTTLFELLCVGMGPWAGNAISENAIRALWPPGIVPAGDARNNQLAPPRTIYVAPGPGQQPSNLRVGNGPI